MQSIEAAHGRFVWFEFMSNDVPAAIAFYSAVVGWTTEAFSFGPDAPPYTMWKTPDGHTIGGVMDLPEPARAMGAPPSWIGNLCVRDVDAAVAQVEALGGQVRQPAFDVPTVGRVAIVADPAGATFALYQPQGEAPGHEELSRPGEVAWSELMSTDPDGVWDFYAGVASWKQTDTMDMGPEMGTYRMFGPAGRSVGGLMASPPGMPMSCWCFYVTVTDLDAAIERAVGLGATVANPPMEVPGGDRVATIIDPEGGMLGLHGR